MFCRIAGARSAEQSVGIMESKAFDTNIMYRELSLCTGDGSFVSIQHKRMDKNWFAATRHRGNGGICWFATTGCRGIRKNQIYTYRKR